MVKIDWSEKSTRRGCIWFVAAIIGVPMVWMGKDIDQLILLAMGIAGGMGLLIKDNK
jgi:hypothetical protein